MQCREYPAQYTVCSVGNALHSTQCVVSSIVNTCSAEWAVQIKVGYHGKSGTRNNQRIKKSYPNTTEPNLRNKDLGLRNKD